jgi:hypothetical protein
MAAKQRALRAYQGVAAEARPTRGRAMQARKNIPTATPSSVPGSQAVQPRGAGASEPGFAGRGLEGDRGGGMARVP